MVTLRRFKIFYYKSEHGQIKQNYSFGLLVCVVLTVQKRVDAGCFQIIAELSTHVDTQGQ